MEHSTGGWKTLLEGEKEDSFGRGLAWGGGGRGRREAAQAHSRDISER
jgi:hypothetical protein